MIDIYLTEEAGELHFTVELGSGQNRVGQFRLTFEEAERAAALLEVTLRQYNRRHGKLTVPVNRRKSHPWPFPAPNEPICEQRGSFGHVCQLKGGHLGLHHQPPNQLDAGSTWSG